MKNESQERNLIARIPPPAYGADGDGSWRYFRQFELPGAQRIIENLLYDQPLEGGLRYFASTDLSRYPPYGSAQNIFLGGKLVEYRREIIAHAQDNNLSLEDLQDGSAKIDGKMSILLTGLHHTAVEIGLGNWRLIPATMVESFPIESMSEPDLDDLFQEGWIALFNAANRYDPWHQNPKQRTTDNAKNFASFAIKSIKGQMINSLSLFERAMNALSPRRDLWEFRKASRILDQRYDHPADLETTVLFIRLKRLYSREPTDEELKGHMDIFLENDKERKRFERSCRKYRQILAMDNTVSLEDVIRLNYRDERGEMTYDETTRGENGRGIASLYDDEPRSPEDIFEEQELKEVIEGVWTVLSPMEQNVLAYRLGLFGQEPHSQQETAEQFGISREQVQSHETRSKRKLRHPTRSHALREYL